MSPKKRILVIDDETNMVELIKFRMEAAGYEVIAAHDGQEGWEKIKTVKPDLVLLDIMMPKMDGYNVCKLAKLDKDLKDIPIIMLTAKGQDQDKMLALNVGADGYISKPFEGKNLLAVIEKALRK